MKVEFRKSFEKDLLKILNARLSEIIQEVIEQVEEAENLTQVSNIKKLKGEADGSTSPMKANQRFAAFC